jgi:quinol monooxygenase YgiN
MSLVSLTRLRVRSWRQLPEFVLHTARTAYRARRDDGCVAVELLRDSGRVFWTRTVWRNAAAMREFFDSPAHRRAMSVLVRLCDEAAVASWKEPSAQLPSWDESHRRMQRDGRPSQISAASPDHCAFNIRPPALGRGRELRLK